MAQYRTFEALRDSCTFTLVVPVNSPEELVNAAHFAECFPNITVEAVRCFDEAVVPTFREWITGTARRLFRAVFPRPSGPLSHRERVALTDSGPFYPFYSLDPAVVEAVEKHLNKGCDIFQAEFADMLTLGPLIEGRLPSVFVHHQLHFVYAQRFLDANAKSDASANYLVRRMFCEERSYLAAFDSVVVFSDADREALRQLGPHLGCHVSPFPIPEEPSAFAQRFTAPVACFVFVASDSHRPNVAGLNWFMKTVWPTIKRRLPDAIIEVIGKWSPASQTSLINYKEIRFVGFVPDLADALQGKIMIVPLWIGSGIRTKILAAWSVCCPVVTTTVGAEGLPGRSGDHFLVVDDAHEFASACVALSRNLEQLNHLAAEGLRLVKASYSLVSVRERRLQIYNELLAASRSGIS